MLLAILSLPALTAEDRVIKLVETTDVHGTIFPYDFINDKPFTIVPRLGVLVPEDRRAPRRARTVVLLDNGDILQGQPTVYYYNFENTKAPHIVSAGHERPRLRRGDRGQPRHRGGPPGLRPPGKEFRFPWLAANAVKADGTPYFTPYTVIERNGLKIAVIGMITPWIPNWLPQQFWTGMSFDDMVKSGPEVDPHREGEGEAGPDRGPVPLRASTSPTAARRRTRPGTRTGPSWWPRACPGSTSFSRATIISPPTRS